jgi:hypothetical protein
MAYLGHVISAVGVAMDEQKVHVVLDWPLPRSAHAVHTFLILAGYYNHFIHDYGSIVAPLTRLLHKEGFWWFQEAEDAFRVLQRALTTTLVLQLLMFDREFVVECDESEAGFSIVLH